MKFGKIHTSLICVLVLSISLLVLKAESITDTSVPQMVEDNASKSDANQPEKSGIKRQELKNSDNWMRYTNEYFGVDFYYPKWSGGDGSSPREYTVEERRTSDGMEVSVVDAQEREWSVQEQDAFFLKHGVESSHHNYRAPFKITVKKFDGEFIEEEDKWNWMLARLQETLSPWHIVDLESIRLSVNQKNWWSYGGCEGDDYSRACYGYNGDISLYREEQAILQDETYYYQIMTGRQELDLYDGDIYHEVFVDNLDYNLWDLEKDTIKTNSYTSEGLNTINALVRFFPPSL